MRLAILISDKIDLKTKVIKKKKGGQTLRDTSLKTIWMTNKHMRRCSTNMASGQCKLKQDTTIYLLECPKSETLTPPNVRIWSNRNSHALLVQIQNGTAAAAAAKSLQSCPTLCDPVDGSPPGSPVPGILQARTLEWVAGSFSNAGK